MKMQSVENSTKEMKYELQVLEHWNMAINVENLVKSKYKWKQ